MYPALDRLTRHGLVTSSKEDIDQHLFGRRNRRYFSLTADGLLFAQLELSCTRHLLDTVQPGP